MRATLLLLLLAATTTRGADVPVGVGTFAVDASPPIGSPLAYDATKEVESPLSCRGVVLLGNEAPIVWCAVDWIGIGNDAHRYFREQLAAAAGTTVDRVVVHTLHQHDAPWCDFAMDELLGANGFRGTQFDSAFARTVIANAAAAVKQAVRDAKSVTHIGVGRGTIAEVASNRRILGPDGRVKYGRMTATKDASVRAMPEGVIDPELKLIAFYDRDRPVAAMTFYATHPQSYYRTGKANPDYPGMARNAREKLTGVPHVHFNGAGGNIGAGKYNDGNPVNRPILADRVAAGMAKAWESVKKSPLKAADVSWSSVAIQLPPAEHLDETKLLAVLRDPATPAVKRSLAASGIVFSRRCRAGATTDLACMRIGSTRVLSMPGELFVEYQLAAQQLRPDFFVAMAAYGDYGPSYIGTAIAYAQGGYETQPTSSFVSPKVESVLVDGLRTLLGLKGGEPLRLGVEAARIETERAKSK